MNNHSMHSHAPIEVTEKNTSDVMIENSVNNSNSHKVAQGRTRFGIADLWKIQRNQRSAMAQRRNIL